MDLMRPARIVLVVALAATLAACSSGSSAPKVSATKNAHRAIAAGAHYVAIGDSYTAAPYTGPSTADDGCLQSSTNYPHQVAATLGLHLTDVSCGGATTGSITTSQRSSTGVSKPPQLDAVGPDTALVTVSIGGNDGNVFAAASSVCLSLTKATTGSPCADLDAAAGGSGLSSKITAMEKSLVEALRAIIKRAPHARVIVVGYPDTLPHQTCAQYPLASGDASWAHGINVKLVAAQKRAATAVGAEYLDVYDATRGHDICSSDPWEAGEQPTAAAAVFHPYATEQAAVAQALKARIQNQAKP